MDKTKSRIYSLLVCLSVCLTDPLSSVSAQDLVPLFRDFIPHEILDNGDYTRMISANLQAKADIHPELLYYEIERLRALYSDNKTIRREKEDWARKAEQKFRIRKNDWLQSQMQKLVATEANFEFRKRSEAYLSESINDSFGSDSLSAYTTDADTNLIHFFVFLFLTKDSTYHFDPLVDYRALRKASEESRLSQIQFSFLTHTDSLALVTDDAVKRLLTSWYLFDDCATLLENDTSFRDAYQMIETLVRTDYSEVNALNVSLSVGFCPLSSLTAVSQTLPVTYVQYFSYAHQNPDFRGPVVHVRPLAMQSVASIGYQLPLRESVGFCSFMEIKAAAYFGLGTWTKSSSSNTETNYTEGTITVTQSDANTQNVRLNSENIYALKAAVPLVALGRETYIEIAGTVGLLRIAYTVNYSSAMKRTEGYLAGTFFEPYYYSHEIARASGGGIVSQAENRFIVYPSIDVVTSVAAAMRLRCNLWIHNIEIGFEYLL